jgi:DNA-binding CsgD family transcriptional regulator
MSISKHGENLKDFFLENFDYLNDLQIAQKESLSTIEYELMEKILKTSPTMFLITDYSSLMDYLYASKNMETILGYPTTCATQNGGINFITSLYDPNQVEIYLKNIYTRSFEIMNEYTGKNKVKSLRTYSTLKFKKSDGNYYWFLIDFQIHETFDNGVPSIGIIYATDISKIKKDSIVNFMIYEIDENGKEIEILSENYISNNSLGISQREYEVLALISKGKTAIEIGETLFISENTVNSHKKNLLKKMNAATTHELIKKSVQEGFISE